MPIYFSCSKCNKAMFAQEQYAGRKVACPDCKERNLIPSPPAPSSALAPAPSAALAPAPDSARAASLAEPAPGGDSHLIDMEKGPAAPVAAAMAAGAALAPESPAQSMGETIPTTPAAVDGEATRRCPVCAETIKAAAKKCRFCNSLLDEDLRDAEEHKQKEMVIARVLYLAQRSAATWRGLSVVVTGMAGGMMLLITLQGMQQSAPGTLLLFNVLLMVGLLWSMLQMKDGPAQVFVSAALAVALCLPINIMLGVPFDDQVLKAVQDQNPQLKNTPIEQLRMTLCAFGLGLGVLASIPLWIAALKVGAVERLKTALGIKS